MRRKWTATCAVCGFEFVSTEIQKRWDGLRVCLRDYEKRHPLDSIKPRLENSQILPWTRPEPTPVYIGPSYQLDSEYWVDYSVIPSEEDFSTWYVSPFA